MQWTRLAATVAMLAVLSGGLFGFQDLPAQNPLDGNADAIRAGMGLFRGRCADCHGMDAHGVRGPDITQVWASGRTDDGLFKIVKGGIPGTEMPANPRIFDHEAWQILAYLRTLAASAPTDPPRGNAEKGEAIFRTQCANCHRAKGVGGRLGPDLSRIGSARSRDLLVRRIRGGIEGFRQGFEPVTLTPNTGSPIFGVKKNEDLFSVQIMDTTERIQGYEKDKMKSVTNRRSLMPTYGPSVLSESDLDDLISYLMTLRGFNPAVPQ